MTTSIKPGQVTKAIQAALDKADAIKPGTVQASDTGTVSDFQRETLERAEVLGFSVEKVGTVFILTRGKVTIKVMHSAKGYVRTVELSGQPVILPGQKLKHKTLQSLMTKVVKG